jgi:hypothetical protein
LEAIPVFLAFLIGEKFVNMNERQHFKTKVRNFLLKMIQFELLMSSINNETEVDHDEVYTE